MYIGFLGQGSQSFSLGDMYRGAEVAQHNLGLKTKIHVKHFICKY